MEKSEQRLAQVLPVDEWIIVTLWVTAKQFYSHADSSRVVADGNKADTTSDNWWSQFTHLRYVRVTVASQHLFPNISKHFCKKTV